jgi:acetyl-CoA synthetase
MDLTRESLLEAGATADQTDLILDKIEEGKGQPADTVWLELTRTVLRNTVPYAVHRQVFEWIYKNWKSEQSPPPAWKPTPEEIESSNINLICRQNGFHSYKELYSWSTTERGAFWENVIKNLGVRFTREPETTLDQSDGPENARWLPGARLNIADSCFNAPPEDVAIYYQAEGGEINKVTNRELDKLSNRIANSMIHFGLRTGDPIAIDMPMTVEAVAAYLGIVKAGCIVVSIADSFASEQIATRLRISGAKVVLTQDVLFRAGKTLPMYEKVLNAGAERVIVILADAAPEDSPLVKLRDGDVWWTDFLVEDDNFESVQMGPDDAVNILFSSGTTGDPKAVPWTHTTPIKCAMDGYLHQDIHPGDVVAWPTNLGWMMGPWLIFASLVNRASMMLYYGSPVSREFCLMVQDTGVTMLGLVPAIVRAWKAADTAHDLDWSNIKVFSSTGEPSNPGDYLYLMSLANYRPVIEYCGGTEIGGGFVCGTVVQAASPSTFTTPAFGISFYILDENNRETGTGELFLVPPSIGLSNRLINRDHHEVYFDNTPPGPGGELLRRHGDEKQRLPGGYYRALGRADDTMNLGGIKVSSAEIEFVVTHVEGVSETAAIAVSPPGGGPSQLVVYAVPEADARPDKFELRMGMQRAISKGLNPLFKVHDVVVVDSLPRTASNKVMRRVLRKEYEEAGTSPNK